ncbi:TIGR02678 family protein [Bacillus sp. V3-13]|uniref:TIGR02678 family protein n=1 Tax=Bacillus sp. V3-13 TaxID=2053728 RepID=UPI000C794DF3|nr:TIGR02678 family protein [Bacillus sp. V3-13]PLR79073.1 TIGR02678 family protein [Bacillus sp. V3-13]
MEENLFDDKAQRAMQLLFDHYWILRADHPDWYQMVREREKVLRRYIDEKFGLRLIMHRHFAKLEKIPVQPESWMGIQQFQEPMDYAIFCCALSFLEGKAIDEQFLLSEFCDSIRAEYPGDIPLDWTIYTHRKSLIRAVQKLTDFQLMRTIDGDVNKFDNDQDQEALYEVTTYSRYFMRSYPEDLFNYTDWEDILNEEWKLQGDDERRKRVYRQLFMSPAIYRKQQNDPDFLYLRNFRNRITDDIEKHTPFQFSLYKNVAMLTVSEPKSYQTIFPDQKASSDLILQLSTVIHMKKDQFTPNERGEILLTEGEFDQLIDELYDKFSAGWSKAYREASTTTIRRDLLNMMEAWLMAEVNPETGMILLKPLLGLLSGTYPKDFMKEEDEDGWNE